MARKKISVIGAGNVGATCAHWLATKTIGDIVLLDIVDGLPQGKALDLYEAAPIGGFDVNIIGTCDYQLTKDSDIVVITSGMKRKPGMSRDELLKVNTNIVAEITSQVTKFSPDAYLVIVSNPLDAMTYVAGKVSKLPKNKILGMAGVLDTARYRAFIAQEIGVSVTSVSALLLGGHGDDMVPLPRYTSVEGIPLTELMSQEKIDAIIDRTCNGGLEIVNLLKTFSAYYAPSAGAAEMVEAILKDQKKIRPCCVWCQDEYDVGGAYVGAPVILGSNGVEKIIELKLNTQEKKLFQNSVAHVRQLMKQIDAII